MGTGEEGKRAFVYILCNDRKNVFYVGVTSELKKRVYFHKKRLIPGFTKKYNVFNLIHFESFPTLEAAAVREKYLKGKSRAKKLALARTKNPDMGDLYFDL